MADLTRRDPLKAARRDPFSELLQMQRDMERLFSQVFGGNAPPVEVTAGGEWAPPVEVYRKGSDLVLKCELAGVDHNDVDVSFDQSANQIVIKGERKQETANEDYTYREVAYGKFERRFTLPAGVKLDQLKAKYTNGMLAITVPAAEAAQPRKIQIETAPAEAEKTKKAA
jgi:HSP20 family protein